MAPVDIAPFLDEIGTTPLTRSIFAAAAFSYGIDNASFTLLSLFVARGTATGAPSSDGLPLYTTLLHFGGTAAGAALAGSVASRWGRMPSFLGTLVAVAAAAFALACPIPPAAVHLAIFLIGLGVGANMPIDSAIIAEFSPSLVRGHSSVTASLAWSFGSVAAAGVVLFASSAAAHGTTMRTSYAVFGAVTLAGVIFRVMQRPPESPLWLATRGRWREVRAALERLAESMTDRLAARTVLYELAAFDWPADETPSRAAARRFAAPNATLGQLMCGPHGRTAGLLGFIWFATAIGFGAINFFAPTLLISHNKHVTPDAALAAVARDTVIYAIAGIPGSLVGARLVEHRKVGRRRTLAGSTAACAACILLLVSRAVTQSNASVLATLAIFNCAAQVMFAVLYCYTPEVFPTEVRTTATGACSALARVAGLIFPVIFAMAGFAWAEAVAVAAFALSTAAAIALRTETRGVALD